MTTQTERDAVANVIRKILDDQFGTDIVFDPIIVKDAVDIVDGSEYLRIEIVFEGDRKLMTPKWRIIMRGVARRKMAELDINEFPVMSFVEKSDWEAFMAGEYYESA